MKHAIDRHNIYRNDRGMHGRTNYSCGDGSGCRHFTRVRFARLYAAQISRGMRLLMTGRIDSREHESMRTVLLLVLLKVKPVGSGRASTTLSTAPN